MNDCQMWVGLAVRPASELVGRLGRTSAGHLAGCRLDPRGAVTMKYPQRP